MYYYYYASKIINQISNFGKSYQALTIDTVKGFLIDSKSQNLKFRLCREDLLTLRNLHFCQILSPNFLNIALPSSSNFSAIFISSHLLSGNLI